MSTKLTQELSVETAVEEVVRLSHERGVAPSEVAGEIAGAVNGGPAGEELCRQGLIYMANNTIHKGRNGRGEEVLESEVHRAPSDSGSSSNGGGPGGTPGLRAETQRMNRLEDIRLMTADGERQRPLIQLTVRDLDVNASRYRAQERGARKKAEFLERAVKSVRSAGAERIEGLSETTREKLEQHAREAWS